MKIGSLIFACVSSSSLDCFWVLSGCRWGWGRNSTRYLAVLPRIYCQKCHLETRCDQPQLACKAIENAFSWLLRQGKQYSSNAVFWVVVILAVFSMHARTCCQKQHIYIYISIAMLFLFFVLFLTIKGIIHSLYNCRCTIRFLQCNT